MRTTTSEAGATASLATIALGVDFSALDQKTIDWAKLLLLDHLGCQLIGSVMPWTKIVFRCLSASGGNPEARVVNYGTRLSTQDAASINAVFGQGCEWDDYSTRGMGGAHTGAGTWPVALALGERFHFSGREMLAASIAGCECMARIGKAVRPSSDRRGHHPQGLLTPFGAAATSGWLLRLSEHQMTMALSIASSYSGGVNEFTKTGGEVKRLYAGNGVRGGMMSAFLSQQGFTGPPTILEGEEGFCHAFSDEPNLDELSKRSDHYAILESDMKVYPAGGLSASSIETMGKLIDAHGFSHADIESIRVAVSSKAAAYDMIVPTDVSSAQFSVPFSIAVRTVVGKNDLGQYMDNKLWNDERITNIARRIRLETSSEAVGDNRHCCRMAVVLKDGSKYEAFTLHPQGSFLNPLSAEDVKNKFALMAGSILKDRRISEVISLVDEIESLHDVAELVDLLCVR